MEIGDFEANNTLGMLLDRVERGEEITITRHGRPVARLVPNSAQIDRVRAHVALDRIRKRAGNAGEVFDWAATKAGRDVGRP